MKKLPRIISVGFHIPDSTTDYIFSINQILETALAIHRLDSVRREVLNNILIEFFLLHIKLVRLCLN
jgi:hypothetical protein